MSIQRLLCMMMLVSLLIGCAGLPYKLVPPEIENIDTPPLNSVQIREVGDTLVEQANLLKYEALVPNKPLLYTALTGERFTYEGDLVANISSIDGTKAHCGTLIQILRGDRRKNLGKGCLTKKMLDEHWNMPPETYSIETIKRVSPNSFQRQLIYTGKSGKSIFVTYREFTADTARPAFTQNFTFDLDDGDVIGAKGVRIKVLKASNTSLKYILLSPFPR